MTQEQWHADIHVTKDIAHLCISSQFPELCPIQSIKALGEGWDNIVFLINEVWVFRFPRRKIAVPLIERENIVLPHLPALSSLSLPIPKFIGNPSRTFPYPFHGYKLIPGNPASELTLSDKARQHSIQPLATFLKNLHTIDKNKAESIGAGPQVFNRMDFNRIKEQLLDRFTKIHKRISPPNEQIIKQEISKAEFKSFQPLEVLVHGDLYARHLMFSNETLTGIIDWGDMGINHPAIDLAVVHSFYNPCDHSQFLDIYGHVTRECWAYARFLGLYSAVTMLIYAFDLNDQNLFKEAKASILRINHQILPSLNP